MEPGPRSEGNGTLGLMGVGPLLYGLSAQPERTYRTTQARKSSFTKGFRPCGGERIHGCWRFDQKDTARVPRNVRGAAGLNW